MILFDTSSLILLAKTDLLQVLCEKTPVEIPREVFKEALAKPGAYDAQLIDQLMKDGKIKISNDAPNELCQIFQKQFRIARAEAATLVLAKQQNAILAIDDGPGIKAAKILGVPFLTAISVLVELRAKDRISQKAAVAKLELLQQFGRYGVQIIEDARKRLEEQR